MNRIFPLNWLRLSFTISAITASSLLAADPPSLDPHLESLRPLLEKTLKGQGKATNADKPYTDVTHWERALNGRAIRITHSLNDGAYGGECIVLWGEEKKAVTYFYFTTDTFRTEGTMTVENGKISTHEVVKGTSEGVREVRSTITMNPNGGYTQKSEYLAKGEWKPARETVYKADPDARVVFK
jgi:hypothetical protein